MKKLLAVLLTAAMTLSMLVVPVTVSAETTETTTTATNVGYQTVAPVYTTENVEENDITDLSGLSTAPTSGSYCITDYNGMVKLAKFVNEDQATMAGVTIYLLNNIDMTSVENFAGIGTATTPFAGTFDGQGYAITNLSMSSVSTANFGVFASIKGAAISNVVLAETCTFNHSHSNDAKNGNGTLVGMIYDQGTVQNVLVNATVNQMSSGNTHYFGGIVGQTTTKDSSATQDIKITNCQFSGTISQAPSNPHVIGGVLGYSNNSETVISNCLNTAAIYTRWGYGTGGILGASTAFVKIENCKNAGNISCKEQTGGIVGYAGNIEILSCENTGVITSIGSGAKLGGIIGNVSSRCVVQNCTNSGALMSVNGYSGGIVGNSSGVTTISNSKNEAAINPTSSDAAGIIGYSNGTLEVTYCVNNGAINNVTDDIRGQPRLAGIVGQAAGTKATISNCENNGVVNGQSRIAGIVGEAAASTLTVEKCLNFGTITAGYNTSSDGAVAYNCSGGIVGRVNTNGSISNCTNYGAISHTVAGYAGGIIGTVADGKTVTFNALINKGTQSHSTGASDWLCGNKSATTATINGADSCYDVTEEGYATHFTGYQIGTYTENEVSGNKIRLVGTIGSDYANYDEVGFIVKITRESDGEVKTVEHYCEAIYSSLLAENNNTVAASKYRQGGYMFALALYGISAGEYTFEVQTISLAMNGESYTVGETSTFDCTIPVPAA